MVVVDEGLQFLRYGKALLQIQRLVPSPFIAEIQHQRHHRIAFLGLILLVCIQLIPIYRPIISDDAERDVSLDVRLIFQADEGYAYLPFLPELGYITLLLAHFPVYLVDGARQGCQQVLRLHQPFPLEEQYVHQVAEYVRIVF